MTTTTSGHPGIGDPAREPPSRRDRGAHRFPCRAKTRMSRAEGASRPRSLAPPARLPDWPTDGRRRTTRTRTRAGFSPLDASDVPKKVCLQHDSITRDRTSSLHRVARAAARAPRASWRPAPPPRSRARARSSRRSSRSRARPVARVRAVSRRFGARPPPARRAIDACDACRGERGGPRDALAREAKLARGSARRSASRTPPTPSARSSARSTPRAVPEGAGYGTHTRPSPSPPRRRRRLYPPPTTTPPPPPPPPPPR